MKTAQSSAKITIDNTLYKKYPDIRLGCIQFNTTVTKPSNQFWDYMDKNVLPKVRKNIEGKTWGEIPGVKGSRKAYKTFGRDPSRYRVSSEALLRRVKRKDALYRINSVVDVNNLVSVQSGCSVGSYDLDNISGNITLRKAEVGEGYKGIGKGFIDMENMLVLADDKGIFGSSTSDSERTMVTNKTTIILVVIYVFENEINLEDLLEFAKESFIRFAKAFNMSSWVVQ